MVLNRKYRSFTYEGIVPMRIVPFKDVRTSWVRRALFLWRKPADAVERERPYRDMLARVQAESPQLAILLRRHRDGRREGC